MWVRKSYQELMDSSKYKKPNIYKYILLFVFFFLLALIKEKLSGENWDRFRTYYYHEPLSWTEVLNHIPRYSIISLIITTFIFIYIEIIVIKAKKKNIYAINVMHLQKILQKKYANAEDNLLT